VRKTKLSLVASIPAPTRGRKKGGRREKTGERRREKGIRNKE